MEGLDKDEDPIVIQRFGVTDSVGLLKTRGKTEIEDALLFFIELLTNRGDNIPRFRLAKKLLWTQDK